jgi:hypothetical protein
MKKPKTKKTRGPQKRPAKPRKSPSLAPKPSAGLQEPPGASEAGQAQPGQRPMSKATEAFARVFDSIAAAAAGMGIPKSRIRKAKKEGAPGFRGSRVYETELAAWLEDEVEETPAATGAMEKDALECRKLRAQAERIEFENNTRYGQFVARLDIAKHLKMFGAELGQARNEFRTTFPALVVGKGVEEIRAECDKAWDAMFVKFNNHFQQWTI